MMRSIGKTSNSLLMKLLLGGLAVSFGLWGIGDVLRVGFSGSYALKSGDKEISLAEYDDELKMRYAALRQVMGANLTPELAERLGIRQQVINDLQTGLLIQREAESLGLRVPQAEIIKAMRETSAFQLNGEFNKDSFKQALRQAGISEQRYIDSLNKETLSKLVLQNFSEFRPKLTEEATILSRLRNETRDVILYRFTPSIADKDIAAADDRALEDYYKTYGEQFRVPEYRKLAWVVINKGEIAKTLNPDDDALKQLYEERKDSFNTPEQREVSQLLYDSRDQAEAALALLRQGKIFGEVVKAVPPKNDMLSLGVVSGEALPEEARDQVMALKKGDFTPAIETAFGWHVFRVENIVPAQTKSFDDVKEHLATEWRNGRLEDKLYDISVDIEDGIAAGMTLAESAKEFSLPVTTSEMMDAQGNRPDGSKADTSTLPAGVLAQGFKLRDETDSGTVEDKQGDYIMVSVAERKASYIPPLKDVRSEVETAWKAKKTRDMQYEKSLTLTEGAKNDHAKLSSDVFKPLNVAGVNLNGNLPSSIVSAMTELPQGLRQEIFTTPVGEVTESYVYDTQKGSYVLARVTAVHSQADNADTAKQAEKVVAELEKQYSEDVLSLYLHHLSKKYPVEINQSAISQLR